MELTEKQLDLMHLWQDGELKRLNILEGSVSSGKTYSSLLLWALWVSTMPENGLFLMAGKSITTLKRNCLYLLQGLIGESNFQFSTTTKEGRIFGRRILLEGANDIRSESKIRGLTLHGAYCDELTLMPRDFFVMLLSRLRAPKAKLIATTNPDSPSHWLKKEYIDRAGEIDLLDLHYTIDDNTTLDPSYVKAIKSEYTGVFYDRFILGKWCLAEGIIYPQFTPEEHIKADALVNGEWYVSIDYGTMNAFSAGLWCYDKHAKVGYKKKEWYYSGRDTHTQLTNSDYLEKVKELAEGYDLTSVIVDPSATSFITELRRAGFRIRKGRNNVVEGIREVSSALGTHRLYFDPSCADTIREFGLYSWDSKATEDKPIKENDHAMDEMRYFVNTIMRDRFKASGVSGGL